MKNLNTFKKYFENDEFVDDVLGKADPEKPIHRNDLEGKPYNDREVPEKDVVYAVEFVAAGTFQSYYNAQKYLKDMGYNIGSMQGPAPIGFSSEYDYISKWRNMTRTEHAQLDGVILSKDFREGNTLVLFFNPPKF